MARLAQQAHLLKQLVQAQYLFSGLELFSVIASFLGLGLLGMLAFTHGSFLANPIVAGLYFIGLALGVVLPLLGLFLANRLGHRQAWAWIIVLILHGWNILSSGRAILETFINVLKVIARPGSFPNGGLVTALFAPQILFAFALFLVKLFLSCAIIHLLLTLREEFFTPKRSARARRVSPR